MLFFILVCLFLLLAIPLVQYALKNSGQESRGSDSSNFSDDGTFYTASASERYGAPLESATPEASDTTACNDTDSGSCDGGGSDSNSD